jgi:uncharacterized protein YbjT (DUF2867 family)
LARALIVACGCRGRRLAQDLLEDGWQVRGTTRGPQLQPIEAAGAEAVEADPDRLATLVEHLRDVAIVYWLLGSAKGERERVAALHGERLASFLAALVDTPVRGFVYERAGTAPEACLAAGEGLVREAGERWRIPAKAVAAAPRSEAWQREMAAAGSDLLGVP